MRAEILSFRERYSRLDSIRVQANGSAEGMEMLVNGEVSMSLLMRDLTDPEVDAAIKREGLEAYPIAWDGVAVIVNPASPVEQLSRTELGEIYPGRRRSGPL
jgi:phosphate transport system substrate-binding protein